MRSSDGALSSRQEAIMQNQDALERIFEMAVGVALLAAVATFTMLLLRVIVAAIPLFEATRLSAPLF
jgi:ABC-type phosphate transport system permease subunit